MEAANRQKWLIVILGPTAVGKTALSVELARHYSSEILSCDSRQIFQEMSIGVSRPSQQELSAVPTHFIASHSIHERYSAGQYGAEALQLLGELFDRHNKVFCCGGSMLYLDAIINGFDNLPGDEAVRQELNMRLEKFGLVSLQEQLRVLDPKYYAEVDLNNPHRLVRALEVCLVTGNSFSDQRTGKKLELPFSVCKIGLKMARETLRKRIDSRVDQMFEDGLVDEVKSLIEARHLCKSQSRDRYFPRRNVR